MYYIKYGVAEPIYFEEAKNFKKTLNTIAHILEVELEQGILTEVRIGTTRTFEEKDGQSIRE